MPRSPLDNYTTITKNLFDTQFFFIKYGMSIIQYLAIFVKIIFLYLLSVKHFYASLFFYAWLHKICSSHNLFYKI